MRGDPVLGVTRDPEKGFEVIETGRSPIAPRAGLVLERTGERRCEERTLFDGILPDRRLDVATSQLARGLFVGRHRVSSLVEMKWALTQEEESPRTVHRGSTTRRR